MTFMSWRKEYEVGVPQIDDEHRRLFSLINEYHDEHARGDTRAQIPRLLNQLVSYAEEHFQHEEKLMSDNGYPLLDKHRELHHDLVASVFAINERLAADPGRARTEILQLVKNWLVDHIIKNDIDIAEFLQRRNNQAIKARHDEAAEKPEDKAPADAAKKSKTGGGEATNPPG